MKKPRIEAFDSKNKKREIKPEKIDMTGLPTIKKAQEISRETQTRTPERPPVPTPERPPVRRTIKRCSFEIFLDQIETLRKISIDEKSRGEMGSMSQMVREAVDAYLEKKEQ